MKKGETLKKKIIKAIKKTIKDDGFTCDCPLCCSWAAKNIHHREPEYWKR